MTANIITVAAATAALTVLPANSLAAGGHNIIETVQAEADKSGGTADSAKADRLEAAIEADLVSRYVWRGQDYGAVSLQPTLALSYKGLSLEAWGNVGLSDPHDDEEIELTLRYEHSCGLHVALTDYWMAYGKRAIDSGEVSDPDNRYFCYSSHSTNHVFEANIGCDFGLFSLDWFTNFAGDDSRTVNGHRQYSSYMEANIPFTLASCDWTATVGAVPFKTGYYDRADGFAVVNVSLTAEKALPMTRNFSLPLYAGLAANPSDRKAYFFFGLTVGI